MIFLTSPHPSKKVKLEKTGFCIKLFGDLFIREDQFTIYSLAVQIFFCCSFAASRQDKLKYNGLIIKFCFSQPSDRFQVISKVHLSEVNNLLIFWP